MSPWYDEWVADQKDGFTRVGEQANDCGSWEYWRLGIDLERRAALCKAADESGDKLQIPNNLFARLSLGTTWLAQPSSLGPQTGSEDTDSAESVTSGSTSPASSPRSTPLELSPPISRRPSISSSEAPTPLVTPASIGPDSGSILEVPVSRRPTWQLLREKDVWNFSLFERHQINKELRDEAKRRANEAHLATVAALFQQLSSEYEVHQKEVSRLKDLNRGQALAYADIVGGTTNGAARYGEAIKGFAPKVVIFEEAGQILEAHTLCALFPTVQHVISLGDPLQLRAIPNYYEFSVDNPKGAEFKFDVSYMERASTAGLPMSQLQVQRRMLPQISLFIANTLYPVLEDHPCVKQYPNVVGMESNIFFLDHRHAETSAAGRKLHNKYEADMVCELVLYLLKQGCYSEEGDIVILCAYLGQLMQIRNKIQHQVTLVFDERDEKQVAKMDEQSGHVAGNRAASTKHKVLLRTVDSFQGEEAKVCVRANVSKRSVSTRLTPPVSSCHLFETLARQMTGTMNQQGRRLASSSRRTAPTWPCHGPSMACTSSAMPRNSQKGAPCGSRSSATFQRRKPSAQRSLSSASVTTRYRRSTAQSSLPTCHLMVDVMSLGEWMCGQSNGTF